MRREDIPNIITFFRFLLTIPILFVLLNEYYLLAFLLFIFAAISDGLDGYLARRYHWTSRLGTILDPLSDKFLLIGCYSVLTWLGYIPVLLFSLVILRDVVIVLGAMIYHYWIGPFELKPRPLSKINTFFQIVLVVALLLYLAFAMISHGLLSLLIMAVFITSTFSFIDYLWVWGRKAYLNKTKPIKEAFGE